MERKIARNWYWWLWLSPLLTIHTLIILAFSEPGYGLVCGGYWIGCDRELADIVTILIAVLGSALWHLILLFPALNKGSEFIRWHGRQMLLLAGLRTAIPLAFGLAFGGEFEILLSIPVLIAVWFFGTLWGQVQASRGSCSLMRWFGREEAIPPPKLAVESYLEKPETLVKIIRYSSTPEQRGKALFNLQKRGMVMPAFERIVSQAQVKEMDSRVEALVDTIRHSPDSDERSNALQKLRHLGFVEQL